MTVLFHLSLDKPGPPAGSINFNLITADRITFRWEPVCEADQGGSQVTHYIVERRETSRVVWSTVSERHEQTYISVGKLVRGNEYVFRVMAVNKYGMGEPLESEAVVAKNAFGKLWNPGLFSLSVSQSSKSYPRPVFSWHQS